MKKIGSLNNSLEQGIFKINNSLKISSFQFKFESKHNEYAIVDKYIDVKNNCKALERQIYEKDNFIQVNK